VIHILIDKQQWYVVHVCSINLDILEDSHLNDILLNYYTFQIHNIKDI
jgi:hypothetical protein